jgi:hypothetical protein
MAAGIALVLGALTAGEARADAYAYAFQQVGSFSFTGATVGALQTLASTSAVQGNGAIPTNVSGDVQSFDPAQAYVGPGPVPPPNTYSQVGAVNPDYVRGDADIALNFSTIRNVAEGFLTPPGTSNSSGQWSVSAPITLATAGTVSLSFSYTNALEVILNGGPGIASASYQFGFTISQGSTVIAEFSPTEVNSGASLTSPGTVTQPSTSGSLTLSTALGAGTYQATITGSEKVFLTQQPAIPEPSSVVLLGSGIVLALGCSLRRSRKPHLAA